jgi:hypothetical protein
VAVQGPQIWTVLTLQHRQMASLIIECLLHLHRPALARAGSLITVNNNRRLPSTVTLHQAVGESPSLARLTELVRESNQRLKAIEGLIPGTLLSAIKAGPIDGENWCLLVSGNAAAAKIRQLIPLIQASLLRQGWKVTTVRLKILVSKKK